MKLILPYLFIFISISLFAQEREIITVSAHENAKEVLLKKGLYHYDHFRTGKVYFKDGTASVAKLNYNLLLQELMFITPGNDTLAVDGKEAIKLIVIDNDSLYYSNGFIELLKTSSYPKLGIKSFIKLSNKQKKGAYDIPTSTSDMKSYKAYQTARPNDKVIIDETSVFTKLSQYYLLDSDMNFYPVNEKSLIKRFPDKQAMIKKYFEEKRNKPIDQKQVLSLLDIVKQ